MGQENTSGKESKSRGRHAKRRKKKKKKKWCGKRQRIMRSAPPKAKVTEDSEDAQLHRLLGRSTDVPSPRPSNDHPL
jgi:hypothetical protein